MSIAVVDFKVFVLRDNLTDQNFTDLATFRKGIAALSGATLIRIQASMVDASGNEFSGEYMFGVIPNSQASAALTLLNTLNTALGAAVLAWDNSASTQP